MEAVNISSKEIKSYIKYNALIYYTFIKNNMGIREISKNFEMSSQNWYSMKKRLDRLETLEKLENMYYYYFNFYLKGKEKVDK